MSTRSTETTLPSRDGRSGSEAEAPSAWALTVLQSPDRALTARRFDLEASLRIGRVEDAHVDVAIEDAKVSRDHATITRVGIIVELRDRDSRNGTCVNGVRVGTQMLRPGDVVRVGDTLLLLDDKPARVTGARAGLVGAAAAFVAAVELAERIAPSDMPVVLLGETGTGKDVIAQHIHRCSGRTGRFVAVNCAALGDDLVESTLFGHRRGAFTGATSDSQGLFLEAQGGTLFLDEIGDLDIAHQAVLLRALDAREIIPVGGTRCVHTDARVIAATNVELATRIAEGRFRADLYARLAGTVVRMPPLRARRGDILDLAAHVLRESSPVGRTLSARAAEWLLLHPWPRNIRELRSAMRRLALELDDRAEIRRADVEAVLEPPVVAPDPAVEGRSTMPTRDELATQLVGLHGNISQLAAYYRKDAKQIYRWLKRYHLDPASYRD